MRVLIRNGAQRNRADVKQQRTTPDTDDTVTGWSWPDVFHATERRVKNPPPNVKRKLKIRGRHGGGGRKEGGGKPHE